MKCPYCDNEMEQGYIQSRDGVFWSERLRPVAAISVLGGGKTITLHSSEAANGSLTRAALAYCCEACGKVILDVPQGYEL